MLSVPDFNFRVTIISILILSMTFGCFAQDQKGKNPSNPRLGPPPGYYKTTGHKDDIKIPFVIDRMEIMIKAEMNGKKINYLIDNGVMWDQLLFFGSTLVDSLGMNYEGEALVKGAGEGDGAQSYSASGVTISFEGITFYDQEAIITSKESGFAEWWPGVAGQVCGAFFKHFVVEFNFDKNIMTLHKPETFKYKGHGRALKMTRDSTGSYSVPVILNQDGNREISTALFIDIGGEVPIHMAINEESGIRKPEGAVKKRLGYGASGEVNGYEGSFNSVKLAGYELKNLEAKFTEGNSDNTTCTIGLPLLMRFNVVFDYFSELMYIEPNEHLNLPVPLK